MLAVSTTTAYTLSVALASFFVMGVGAVVFLPRLDPVGFLKEFLRTDWKYLGVAWLVTNGVNTVAHRFHAEQTFTWLVYEFEGPVVAAFQSVANEPLTLLFTAAYLVGFPTIVLFTYFKLKAHDEREARRYALAYVVLVLLAVPFFVFVPVGIPALYPAVAVQPLIFDVSPVIRAGMLATDTMVKAFPSLHTGLSVLAALYARKAGVRYAATAGALAALIVFSTFYLGIHWLTDAAFAVVLVGIAYWVSRNVAPERVLPVPAFGGLRPAFLGPDRESE
ncbi:phosphatase PAP2 family protein [Halococcus sediminicola]|uniref:phosphatase PAP2 family protein n=1 Tax=Halococcus sediminicola TaxID=1264579 RepID=UPI000679D9B0|nr:phosphatase PAP2 family protein [Halococcus sediminicola]